MYGYYFVAVVLSVSLKHYVSSTIVQTHIEDSGEKLAANDLVYTMYKYWKIEN